MTKKRIYVTSSLLLASVAIPAIATFAYLNTNVERSVEIELGKNNNNVNYDTSKIYGYETLVNLNAKLTRVSDKHELIYKWYSNSNDSNGWTLLNKDNEKQNSISVKYNGISNVLYYLEVIDQDEDDKKYESKIFNVKYLPPVLYVDGFDKDGNKFNIFQTNITPTTSAITLIPKSNNEINLNDKQSIQGWYIYTLENDSKIWNISELLNNNSLIKNERQFEDLQNYLEIHFEDKKENLLIKKPFEFKEFLNKNKYGIKYWWSNTISSYSFPINFKN